MQEEKTTDELNDYLLLHSNFACPACHERFLFRQTLEHHKEDCLPHRISMKRTGNWRNA